MRALSPVSDLIDMPPSCHHCGQPIGVYEPLVYERPGAGPVRSAFLALPDDVRQTAQPTTFFHVACHATVTSAA
jgi:hypothetical protein